MTWRCAAGDSPQVLLTPVRILGEFSDFAPPMMRPNHRERWHQHCNGEQNGRRPTKERFQSQPEIKSDAGVRPCNREQYELHRDHMCRQDPIGV